VVMVRERDASRHPVCATKGVDAQHTQRAQSLGWDSMASIHVVNDISLIPEAKQVRRPRNAAGVGGVRPITHKGSSPLFNGMRMSFIEGSETPNLMSLGRVLQVDETGLPGMEIFTDSGAVRFRADSDIQRKVSRLVDALEAAGLLESTAVMRKHVYEESFVKRERQRQRQRKRRREVAKKWRREVAKKETGESDISGACFVGRQRRGYPHQATAACSGDWRS